MPARTVRNSPLLMAGRRARAVYNSPEWKRLRIDVLNGAGWRCSKCSRFADEVHHKQPLSEGGAPFDRCQPVDDLPPVPPDASPR